MSTVKTLENDADVVGFINSIDNTQRKNDAMELLKLFTDATGQEPRMWGTSIIGFGKYHYKSERSRQEGDWPLVGFSPRKQNLTLYVINYDIDYSAMLIKLGKCKTSKSCLYINKLDDIDRKVLSKLIRTAYKDAIKTLT